MIQITWYELASYLTNIVLAFLSIYQFLASKKEEENTKSKIRMLQNQAEGIKNALLQIGQNSNAFSSKDDIAAAVTAVSQSAVTLDQAMVEERFYSETEIKQKRMEMEKQQKKLFSMLKTSQS